MNRNIAGTPNIVVTRCAAMSASARPGSKARCRMMSPPFWNVTSVVTLRPPMWKIGAGVSVTSFCSTSKACSALMLFHQKLPCVSMAPFGRPVVPEVYMIIATSSSPTSTRGAGGGAALVQFASSSTTSKRLQRRQFARERAR